MQDIEIWKDIPEYKGLYQVSSFGRVRSLDRDITQKGHKCMFTRRMRGKIIKPRKQNGGYYVVWLSKNGKIKPCTVHRIVLSVFRPNNNDELIVNHIDGNKSNNNLVNLEWITHRENNLHAHSIGLVKTTSNKRVQCIDDGIIYPSIRAAANAVGVTGGAIEQAIRKNQKSKGLRWKLI